MGFPHIPSYVSPTDPRNDTRDRSTIDQSSAAFDPDNEGVGSSYLNDPSASRIFIPEDPTGPGSRYLVRLAAIAVESYQKIRIRGIRQAIGIGCMLRGVDGQGNPIQYPNEIDQLSPFWRFTDGNIAWGLRVLHGPAATHGRRRRDPGVGPGEGTDYASGTDSCRLVDVDPLLNAPAGGYFPGQPAGSLGLFRDLRYFWRAQGGIYSIDYEVAGPCIVGLFASIRQTNPQTRQSMAPLVPNDYIPPVPEDAFVLDLERRELPPARYRHISGAIIADIGQITTILGIDPVQGAAPCG